MHRPAIPRILERRRILVVGFALLGLILPAFHPAGAVAVEPIDVANRTPTAPYPIDGEHELRPQVVPQPPRPTPPPARPAPTPAPTPVATPTPSPPPQGLAVRNPDAPGYDVSWPQCNDGSYPAEISFAIVGVNRGRVYSANPCLGPDGEGPSQLEWAGPDADLYLNTGNPGPELSQFWPHGEAQPRECNTNGNPGGDSAECSYLYGWHAAADGYRTALDAFIALGWAEADAERVPGERTWWLDVETSNSWRRDWSLNVATLQGAVDYLESVDARVGFYSTPLLWWRVTGGTDAFAEYPSWHAGAHDAAEAQRRCEEHQSFTGGELVMVQWVEGGLDLNLRCD